MRGIPENDCEGDKFCPVNRCVEEPFYLRRGISAKICELERQGENPDLKKSTVCPIPGEDSYMKDGVAFRTF